jgi:hypothetical protein
VDFNGLANLPLNRMRIVKQTNKEWLKDEYSKKREKE